MSSKHPNRKSERGYILLTLMLFVALLAIGATVAARSVAFNIQRDREEELIHRGVQYSRAVRKYVKKIGHYPTRIEELENTNNLRFLRRRYKDPITGEDFKLLHLGEVQISFAPAIAGAVPAGQVAAQAQAPNPGTAAGRPGNQATPGQNPADADKSTDDQTEPDPQKQAGFSGPTFGGGPIVGVVSTSKKKSIREFNKKNHYNQWQFIYDPGSDRGGLLTTPNQPPLAGAAGQPGTQPALGPGGLILSQPPQNPPGPSQPSTQPPQ